jgi:hypothetical protein
LPLAIAARMATASNGSRRGLAIAHSHQQLAFETGSPGGR